MARLQMREFEALQLSTVRCPSRESWKLSIKANADWASIENLREDLHRIKDALGSKKVDLYEVSHGLACEDAADTLKARSCRPETEHRRGDEESCYAQG